MLIVPRYRVFAMVVRIKPSRTSSSKLTTRRLSEKLQIREWISGKFNAFK